MRFARPRGVHLFIAFDLFLCWRATVLRCCQVQSGVFLAWNTMNAGEPCTELLGHHLSRLAETRITKEATRDRLALDPFHDEKRYAETVIAEKVWFRCKHTFSIDSLDQAVL